MLFHFRCFFSWDFYLALLNCLRTFHCLVVAPRSPLGRYFAHDTHFALFLVRCFPYFGFILRLLLPLPALLSFVFLRYLLSVACKFITGFRFASYRGVGVGCEAPHLRSISPKFWMDFVPSRFSMHLHLLSFRVGLCHGIPFPLYY